MGFLYSQLFVTPKPLTASFAGQTVIVTGSNVGLGKEAARHFARLDAAKVILAVRNTKAGEEARADILRTTKRDPSVIEVWHLDLSSYASVKAFAKRADAELDRVDVLLENAAVILLKYSTTEDHDTMITVNVISTFLLALLMIPKLKESARKFGTKPRLTFVTSEVHSWTKFPEGKADDIFDALDASGKSGEGLAERYSTTKLLEVLGVRALAPKLEGTGVVVNHVNPGLCHSELARDAGWGLWALKLVLARSTEVGSRTLVAGAAAGEESHGKYMTDGCIADEAVSAFVKSEEGRMTQEKVWVQLKAILEKAAPGVTAGF